MATNLAAVIPIGPGKNTPERRAALRRASVKAVREKMRDLSCVSANTWIYVGKELAGVKKAAKADGAKVFPSMFARNAEERNDPAKYPFSRKTADMLIAVAGTFGTMVPNESLPASWHTLYVLSRIDPERLKRLIESGGVHPMMTRAEAQRMASAPKKRRRKKDGFSTVKRWFRKIEDPANRVERLAELIRDCDVSLDDLRSALNEKKK